MAHLFSLLTTLASLSPAAWLLLAQTGDGPGLDLQKEREQLTENIKTVFLPILVGTVFLVVLLIGGLALYFRRGDQAVRSRLAQARGAGVRFPGQDEEPTDHGPAAAETPPAEQAAPAPPCDPPSEPPKG